MIFFRIFDPTNESSHIQGESKKMSVSEKGSLITNGHFFDSHSIKMK